MGLFKRLGSGVGRIFGTGSQARTAPKSGSTGGLRDTEQVVASKGVTDEDLRKGLDRLRHAIKQGEQDLRDQVRRAFDSPLQQFLAGGMTDVTSSNVATIQWLREEEMLFVGFRSGAWYGYYDVSEREAIGFYESGSKGRAVWDMLRVRGSRWAHKKRYFYMDGPSSYEPRWHTRPEWREQHGRITAEGQLPPEWQGGKGPYPWAGDGGK
jgi:hypothetical protein